MLITVTTLQGLEEVLKTELEDLGVKEMTVGRRAITFEGDMQMVVRCNLMLRTAIRVLIEIKYFQARNERGLYTEIQKIDWSDMIDKDGTFAIRAATSSRFFSNSQYVTHLVKDAIVDQFRDRYSIRPSIDTRNPDLWLHVFINDQKVIISRDSSGDSLHRRGYRKSMGEAPLSEVLAAALVLLSGWDRQSPLLDPMCGTATIPVEAALIHMNQSPHMPSRKFGFEKWKNFDADTMMRVKEEMALHKRPYNARIIGSDNSRKALGSAAVNVEGADLQESIEIVNRNFEDGPAIETPSTIIMNPPYGVRLSPSDIEDFYKNIGDTLKSRYSGHTVWILTSSMTGIKHIGLRPSRKISLMNGSLDCKFLKFEMYKGSKKAKYKEVSE